MIIFIISFGAAIFALGIFIAACCLIRFQKKVYIDIEMPDHQVLQTSASVSRLDNYNNESVLDTVSPLTRKKNKVQPDQMIEAPSPFKS